MARHPHTLRERERTLRRTKREGGGGVFGVQALSRAWHVRGEGLVNSSGARRGQELFVMPVGWYLAAS